MAVLDKCLKNIPVKFQSFVLLGYLDMTRPTIGSFDEVG